MQEVIESFLSIITFMFNVELLPNITPALILGAIITLRFFVFLARKWTT